MVPGSLYLTFRFATATPAITSQNGTISSFAGQSVTAGGAAGAIETLTAITN